MEKRFPWETEVPYNNYANYTRNKFGQRVQKISVNAGFTCPNRDGKVAYGGCTYCNNDSFSPNHLDPAESIRSQVLQGMEFLKKRYKTDQFIVYFQAYSNTYASLEHLKMLYEAALGFPEVIGLTIGTRTDCVDKEILTYLNELGEKYYITIEYGLESMHDETLNHINRGHDFSNWKETVALTKDYSNIHICAHLIFGLPGETEEMMMQNVEAINRSGIHYLKMHQLHIVKNTVLAVEYRKNPFSLFTYDEYLPFIVDFLERLNPKVVIQRLFGEAHPRILIAPNWNVTASQVVSDVKNEFKKRETWQGCNFKADVNKNEFSKITGVY